jgi:hypothetical protein
MKSITDHGFIPLTKAWRDAIRNRFVLASSTAGLNNPAPAPASAVRCNPQHGLNPA